MNPTMIPTEQHVHLDIDLDLHYKFHYRSRGRDGFQLVLHRGDTISFTCGEPFSLRFIRWSPFYEPISREHKLLIIGHVRREAPYGIYEYILEVMKDNQRFTDPANERGAGPRLVVQAVE